MTVSGTTSRISLVACTLWLATIPAHAVDLNSQDLIPAPAGTGAAGAGASSLTVGAASETAAVSGVSASAVSAGVSAVSFLILSFFHTSSTVKVSKSFSMPIKNGCNRMLFSVIYGMPTKHRISVNGLNILLTMQRR